MKNYWVIMKTMVIVFLCVILLPKLTWILFRHALVSYPWIKIRCIVSMYQILVTFFENWILDLDAVLNWFFKTFSLFLNNSKLIIHFPWWLLLFMDNDHFNENFLILHPWPYIHLKRARYSCRLIQKQLWWFSSRKISF